jgi:hypothetical protein
MDIGVGSRHSRSLTGGSDDSIIYNRGKKGKGKGKRSLP